MKDMVIVISGGMDSVTLLYDYRERIGLALTFDYGARLNAREMEWAKYHCEKMGIRHKVVDISFMNGLFRGSLLESPEDMKEGCTEETKKDSIIPFRNGIMLSVACGIAESEGMKYVLIANHSSKTMTLPDCSRRFIDSMDEAMRNGTETGVSIIAPYTDGTKTDIITIGKTLGVDYRETYSCYRGGERHCGRCPACIERKESLRDAGLEDLTEYEQ